VIIANRLVLASEVELVPVGTLPADTRARFAHGDTDFVLSRAHARDVSRVIDASAAALVSCFRVPRTVADAVMEYSRSVGADPETVLVGAWPMLSRLVDDQLLVPDGDRAGTPIEPALAPGTRVDRWSIVRPVYLMDDTELHQVRDDAGRWFALKLARAPFAGGAAPRLDHEATILAHLDGTVSPRLCGRGLVGEWPYLVLDWCPGTDIKTAAFELRALPRLEPQPELLRLALSLLDAYAALHARGVLHGDVHPRNVLVDRQGRVTLLDFALARRVTDDGADIPRAGVPFYLEPELAEAFRGGRRGPPVSDAAEQYSVAALVYSLLTGAHYRDFPLEQPAFLRAVAEDAPLPFADRGAAAWPNVEAVLGRALRKRPDERYPSVAALADDLRRVTAASDQAAAPAQPPPPTLWLAAGGESDAARALVDDLLVRAGQGAETPPGPYTDAPTASVMHGAAGLAYMLYRVALVRGSAELLALADLWATRAAAAASVADAFEDTARGLTREAYRPVSPYHGISGVHCVRALIGRAAGDAVSLWQAVDAFVAATPVPPGDADPDLMLGHAGALLATAHLLDTLDGEDEVPRRRLTSHGDALSVAIWRAVDGFPAMHACSRFPTAGAAHGWAGLLYATLRWSAATNRPMTAAAGSRLEELASYAEPWGRGARWPHSVATDAPERRTYLFSWCNGSAGLVHLWTLAARLTRDPTLTDLADRAAWSTWEHAADSSADICCGLAGAAYALLAHHRATADPVWLRRATALASRAAWLITREPPVRPESLYHGRPGVALLVAELERPSSAAMPFFGEER
jgi:eukaryotic-like serine/threonine-protein kinase